MLPMFEARVENSLSDALGDKGVSDRRMMRDGCMKTFIWSFISCQPRIRSRERMGRGGRMKDAFGPTAGAKKLTKTETRAAKANIGTYRRPDTCSGLHVHRHRVDNRWVYTSRPGLIPH